MQTRTTAVFGAYRNPEDVEEAIGALIIKGFPSETISTLIPEEFTERDRQDGPVALNDAAEKGLTEEITRGTVGLLDNVGAIALPDLGLFVGAGPLMTALSGIEPGLESDGVAVVLQQMGAPDSDARRYEHMLRQCALVLVRCHDPEWAARATQVLRKTGAEVLSSLDALAPPKVRHGGSPL